MTNDIRQVARVLVINDQGQTYLLRGRDPAALQRLPYWFTPGGKIDAGETPSQAACRELREEVGLVITPDHLGQVIGTEESDYQFDGKSYHQSGVFYALFSNHAGLNQAGWTDIELQTIDMGKWWSVSELQSTQETIYPTHLVDLLTAASASKREQIK